MSKFINPFSDWGFKRIFGQEFSKELLLSFLNELLKGEHVITGLAYMDKELLPEAKDRRGAICDIYCQTNTGEHIIVEMQNSFQEFFADRTLYYACRSMSAQGDVGRWDYRLSPVYVVSFMNFAFKGEEHLSKKFRTDVMLMDRDTGQVFSHNLRLIYLMLPLFTKEAEECENDFERWIYLLNNMGSLERMPFDAQDAIWRKLEEVASVTTLTSKERAKYDESLKVMRDNYACYQGAMRLGELRGDEQGEKRGRESERILLITTMRNNGASVSEISRLTSIPQEEVEQLLKS